MWAGKQEAIQALMTPSLATLKPDIQNSINWDTAENVFIEGDNLEVLKLLQNAYNDQVKLIYIDPPYNTGNDFVYKDDFSDPIRHYLEVTGQVDEDGNKLVANTETSGRKHSNWLTMMYPRLVLARNLLTQDGLLAMSLDKNEVHHATLLLDEIFGPENQVAIVSVVNNLKGRSDEANIATAHEYLLLYKRSSFLSLGLALPEAISSTYKLVDEVSGKKYRVLPLRKSGTNSLRSDRPNMFYPFYVQPVTGQVAISPSEDYQEVFPMFPDGREGCWRWGIETAKERVGELRAKPSGDGGWNVFAQDFLEREGGERRAAPKSVWIDPKFTSDLGTYQIKEIMGGNYFDHPKPLGLMEEILNFSVGPNDIVLDLFAGSGSMGHAVELQNLKDGGARRCVSINIAEKIPEDKIAFTAGFRNVADLTRARLHKVAGLSEASTIRGLRALQVFKSNFRVTPTISGEEPKLFQTTLDGNLDPDHATCEILLRLGEKLDNKWRRTELKESASVMCGSSLVISALKLSEETIELAFREKSSVVVFLEDAFAGNDSLKANAFFTAKSKNIIMRTF
jgi:adenine-specific DNA-methyltransferase